jgi:carbon-monoxide dehydrogenase medium subunit
MKPAPFAYYRAGTAAEAVRLLQELGPEAKVLAGGQSLLPLMKLRLARPSAVVDLNRARELDHVREAADHVAFGGIARLSELESPRLARACPILAAAARHIGHPAIRHRGTVCGSLAHADPAAELPVVALALDAELVSVGPRGERRTPAADFFQTYLTTVLEPAEVLVEARFPRLGEDAGWAFLELARRHGDFALVSAAAVLQRDGGGRIGRARVALGSVADRAVRALDAERLLVGERATPALFDAAAAEAAHPLDPPSDVHGSGAYRRHLAAVLVARALAEAWGRAGQP